MLRHRDRECSLFVCEVLRNTGRGPASVDAFVERERFLQHHVQHYRRPERRVLAARYEPGCTCSPCRGCPRVRFSCRAVLLGARPSLSAQARGRHCPPMASGSAASWRIHGAHIALKAESHCSSSSVARRGPELQAARGGRCAVGGILINKSAAAFRKSAHREHVNRSSTWSRHFNFPRRARAADEKERPGV